MKIDAAEIRRRNCYGIGQRNITPYGELIENNTLPELFDKLCAKCEYKKDGRRSISLMHRRKRNWPGLAMTAVKFGISFTKRTLNQANALVNIYTDGSGDGEHGRNGDGAGRESRACGRSWRMSWG